MLNDILYFVFLVLEVALKVGAILLGVGFLAFLVRDLHTGRN